MRTDGKHTKRFASLLKLNELSVVKHPAQEGALVGIIKSAKDSEADVTNKEDGSNMDEMEKKLAELLGETKEDVIKSVKELIEARIAKEKEALKKVADENVKKEHEAANKDTFIEIGGQKLAKSAVTPEIEALLKKMDEKNSEMDHQLAVMKKQVELEACMKEADEKYGHLTGTSLERGKVVYAMKSLDEETRGYLEKALADADSVMGEKFKIVGSAYGGAPVAKEKDNTMLEAIALVNKRYGLEKEGK